MYYIIHASCPPQLALHLRISSVQSQLWHTAAASFPGSVTGMRARAAPPAQHARARAGTWNGKIFCVMGRPSSASRVCSSSSSIAAWPAPLAACAPARRALDLHAYRRAWAVDGHALTPLPQAPQHVLLAAHLPVPPNSSSIQTGLYHESSDSCLAQW